MNLLKDVCSKITNDIDCEHKTVKCMSDAIQANARMIIQHDSEIDDLNRFCGLKGYTIDAVDIEPSVMSGNELKKENNNE